MCYRCSPLWRAGESVFALKGDLGGDFLEPRGQLDSP